jgi:P22 coat protein - gene protein 5
MSNVLADIQPKILSIALESLRENAVFPRLVNTDYSGEAAQKGETINIPVPTKMAVQDVIPGPYSQNQPDMQIDTVPLQMNNWKESAFTLNDKEVLQILDGDVMNMQVREAGIAIANAIDKSLIAFYKGVYNFVGTPGTAPFAGSPAEAIKARAILGKALASFNDRRVVIDTDAEANAIALPAFQYFQNSGTSETQREGDIGRKFGMDWSVDQNLPVHTAGTLNGTLVTSGPATAVTIPDANDPALRNPRSTYTMTITGATNGSTLVAGDILTVVGDTQTYVVLNNAVAAGGSIAASIQPAPKVAWAAGASVSVKPSHQINLAFQRDAIALAVRPLGSNSIAAELGDQSMTMVDPVTGVPLRLQVRSEFNRVRFAVSALWGGGLIRPAHVVRIAG